MRLDILLLIYRILSKWKYISDSADTLNNDKENNRGEHISTVSAKTTLPGNTNI